MSYSPNTWATNDVVTVNKLNNIEQGIATISNVPATNFVANCSYDDNTWSYKLDKTLGDIVTAMQSGKHVQIHFYEDIYVYPEYERKLSYIILVQEINNLNNLNDDSVGKQISMYSGTGFYAYLPEDYPILET